MTTTLLTVGSTLRFDGEYFAHWEVSRFEARTGSRLWGLIKSKEVCQLETAAGIESLSVKLFGTDELSPEWLAEWRDSGGSRYAMSFVGSVLERGHFGHMGWCSWRVRVDRWIEVREHPAKLPSATLRTAETDRPDRSRT